MTKKSHNKKRNVGIIYEQLILKISRSLVENDDKTANQVKKIIKKHFNKNSELFKEYKLLNALAQTKGISDALACSIIDEARNACKSYDTRRLDKEKSLLIKEINIGLGDTNFYKQRVKDYKNYATIQRLLNCWRSAEVKDFSSQTLYEKKLYNLLTSPEVVNDIKKEYTPEVNKLTVKIMTEKFNNKYGALLDEQQQNLVKQYIFAKKGNTVGFINSLKSIKQSVLSEVKQFKSGCDNKILLEKMDSVYQNISNINAEKITDETVGKFLAIINLRKEIHGDSK